ncbi:hypothetical protein CJ030_MR1G017589 [Morella rubra]|uniref:Disease resistance protein At4g27190-like leucine-rich repeats domain-containing protein n=1 Tax=Morella rubra TaxID=262757 RepID=A0A6A1WR68_9ROSI|nr:hypothetical protein CJ030_MR1G017589 [Morella rubra]
MEEIIITENVEEEGKTTSFKELFPRLEELCLGDLSILKRFCIGHNIRFLSLKQLIIEHCPKLISFIFKPDSSGTTAGEKVNANERAHNVGQPLFSEEVTFPSLENLEISNIDNIEFVWDNQFAANSFCKLQILRVRTCANVKSIFPSRMLEVIFQCLNTLHIVDCYSLREVFDIEVPSFQETRPVTTTQLKNLLLTYLPKLKHIWNKDPGGIFSFQNLQEVIIVGCERIKSIFPASISENLMQLEFLKIENCGVEVIIEKEEGREVATTLEFPKLTSLELLSLPNLKCFFPGARPSKWPLLKILCVLDCKGIEIFALKYSSFQETFQLRQPLFVVEEGAFPNLKDLGLELNDTVWPSQLLEELFCKLKFLVVGAVTMD